MTAYRKETKLSSNSSPRSKYGHSTKPTGITIHHWGSTGQKHDNVVGWLRGKAGGTSNTGSSAHYVTSAGRVTQLVKDSRAAWHAGNNTGNGATIGIECRPEMSDDDWDTLVQLCADLEEVHGSMKYYKHSDWKNTACPGKYANRIGELVDAVNAEHKRRKSGGSKPKPKPKPAPAKKKPAKPKKSGTEPEPFPLPDGHWYGPESSNPKNHSGYKPKDRPGIRTWQRQMRDVRGWKAIGRIDGRFGDNCYKVARQFQTEKGLSVDGGVGRETWDASWEEPVT